MNLKPLTVTKQRNGLDSSSPNKMLRDMKQRVKDEIDLEYPSRSKSLELNYLFVMNTNPKSQKEKNILDFLDNEGIFQIHLSVAMKEFLPKSATN